MALFTILHSHKKFERQFLRCHAPQPWLPLPKLQTGEKDFHAAKANRPKEVFDVILTADHESTEMKKPREELVLEWTAVGSTKPSIENVRFQTERSTT